MRRIPLAPILILAAILPSLAEDRSAAIQVLVETKFNEMDTNHDGQITADEVKNPRLLKRLDTNGDGVVTKEEAKGFFSKMAALFAGSEFGQMLPPLGPSPATPATTAERPQEAPKTLPPGEHHIGDLIPDISLPDLHGAKVSLTAYREKKALIIALVSPSCPVSKRYLPTLATLEKDCAAAGAKLVLLSNATPEEEPALASALKSAGLTVPCLRDPGQMLAATLGATASTDAFLLDAAQTLVYRGAIDDQYGLGYNLDAPRHRYLADALTATRSGTLPRPAATEAPGCVLDLTAAKPAAGSAPTYHAEISRLLQNNCVECHRKGGVGPFPLETYEQVAAKSGMIRKMVERRLMPPWFAAAPAAGEHSPWLNDRSLVEPARAQLLTWLEKGKPAGDSALAPMARNWPTEWQIGKPDAVVQIPEPLEVKATGTMPYIHVTVDTGFTEEKWVRGFEVLPTSRDVVHHVLVFVKPPNGGLRDFGNFLAAYVPGNSSVIYPDGFAKSLPAGSKLIFQIHYTPNGTATKDQVRLGLLFNEKPPQHIVRVAEIGNHRLSIPPNADNHPESGTIPVPRPVLVLGLMPHMHLRGKAFKYEATLPDGTKRTLLDVPRYDFNWQFAYRFAEPPTLPAGTTVQATGWFDNSTGNPANPNPAVTVKWGPQTTDEMMLGYVEYCFIGETPQLTAR